MNPRSFFALLLGVSMIGCAAPSIEGTDYTRGSRTSGYGEDEVADDSEETAFAPSLPSTLLKTPAGTTRVSYVEKDGRRLAFGDMLLPPKSKMQGIASAVGQVGLWPNGVIPYVVSSNDRAAVEAGIAMWAKKTTAVRFVRRTNERDYIDVFKGQGCYSAIGRTGGRQELSIGEGCAVGHIVAHELGHALGLFHEQSRADRDSFLRVNTRNADASMIHNFDKVTFPSIGAFDFESIMIYDSFAFSNNGQPTMLRTNGAQVNETTDVSANDAAGVGELYGNAPVGDVGLTDEGAEDTGGQVNSGVTTTANLNLRQGPSTSYGVLLTMPAGSPVELTGQFSGSFVEVVYGGTVGWAHASYLQ